MTVLSDNQQLNFKKEEKKSVIIMDEVDGMKGDRGGINELV